MPRVTREIATLLIPYIKKVNFTFDLFNVNSRSGYEFVKQIYTTRNLKANPTLEADVDNVPGSPPMLVTEFIDGSIFKLDTSTINLNEIRSSVFERAQDVEDNIELAGGSKPGEEPAGGGKGKDSKGGAKKK